MFEVLMLLAFFSAGISRIGSVGTETPPPAARPSLPKTTGDKASGKKPSHHKKRLSSDRSVKRFAARSPRQNPALARPIQVPVVARPLRGNRRGAARPRAAT
jgi:hypothetical protein